MDIIMQRSFHESINGGRTVQEFLQGGRYPVPDDIGQVWIARGWAIAATKRASAPTRKE